MAKRKAKSPDQGAASETFQIPEAIPEQPNPWDEIAASVPRLPDPDGIAPHSPPKAKVKPPLPTGEFDFRRKDVVRSRPKLLGPLLIMKRPAYSRMTATGTELLGDCAIANKLTTREPIKALVTFSPDRKWCFFMPVGPLADDAVDITYHKKVANINFWEPFEGSNKIVEKGYNEYYDLDMTDEPITILGVKGYALYFNLETYKKEKIGERDTELEAAGTETKSRKRSASKGKAAKTQNTATTESGQSEETTEPTDESVPELTASERAYEALLDDRDAKIKELEKKLKAYEKKLGPQ